MPQRQNQRRLIVIDPKLQFRYLILPLVVTVTTAACLFTLFMLQAEQVKTLASNDVRLQTEISRVQTMAAVAVAGVLLGHLGFIVWLGLVASHRIAGPIYRFKKAMKEVAAGSQNVRIKLRDKDQLKDVADVFNEMMDALTIDQNEIEEDDFGDDEDFLGATQPERRQEATGADAEQATQPQGVAET